MLNAVLGRAQQACCRRSGGSASRGPSDYASIEARLFATFMADWRPRAATRRCDTSRSSTRHPRSSTCTRSSCCSSGCSKRTGLQPSIADPAELALARRTACGTRPGRSIWSTTASPTSTSNGRRTRRCARLRAADAVVVTPHPHSARAIREQAPPRAAHRRDRGCGVGVSQSRSRQVLLENVPANRGREGRRCRSACGAIASGLFFKPVARFRQPRGLSRRQDHAPCLRTRSWPATTSRRPSCRRASASSKVTTRRRC